MDEVPEGGEELATVEQGCTGSHPDPNDTVSNLAFGRNREKIRILADIVSPMPAEWFRNPSGTEQDLF